MAATTGVSTTESTQVGVCGRLVAGYCLKSFVKASWLCGYMVIPGTSALVWALQDRPLAVGNITCNAPSVCTYMSTWLMISLGHSGVCKGSRLNMC